MVFSSKICNFTFYNTNIMPDNRLNERLLRIRAIHELFTAHPGHSFKPEEIISYVLSKDSSWNYNRFKLTRDIAFMKKDRNLKIFTETCSPGSGKGRSITKYGYENDGETLYRDNVTLEDKLLIKDILETLDLKGLSSLNSFLKFEKRYAKEISCSFKPIISFTKNPLESRSGNVFANLYTHIRQKNVVSFKMHSRNYPYPQKSYQVHPWYLHEYNRRWYLFGLDIKENKIKRYPLDRIHGPIRILKKKYIPSSQSIEEILSTIIGVSLTETEPIEIIFWVSDVSADYVARKKMHKTQEEITVPEDSCYMGMVGHRQHGKFFKMTCENNYELRREMLSFNSELVVLAPESLRLEIKENIERMLNNYNDKSH